MFNTNVTLNLYDLGTNQIGTNSYTAYIVGSNLLGSGAGLAISHSNQPNGILQFDFEDEDQVPLQAGHIYAFELSGTAGSTPFFWQRVTSDVYSGGAAYRNRSRIVFNNTARDFAMAVYTNHAELPPPPTPVPGCGSAENPCDAD